MMKEFFKRELFYFKAMNLAPFHIVPPVIDECPYLLKKHCPIWNCAFHYDSLFPNALYCKSCNMKNLVSNSVILLDEGRF